MKEATEFSFESVLELCLKFSLKRKTEVVTELALDPTEAGSKRQNEESTAELETIF